MEQNKERDDLARNIQKECYAFTNEILDQLMQRKDTRDIESQDVTNIFFYQKLAEIELRLRELERRTTISQN